MRRNVVGDRQHSVAAIDDARDATTATDGTNDGSGTTKDGRDGGGCREELVRLEASLATLTSRDLVDLPGHPLLSVGSLGTLCFLWVALYLS